MPPPNSAPHVNGCVMDSHLVDRIVKQMPDLERLALPIRGVSDSVLQILLKNATKLTHLEVEVELSDELARMIPSRLVVTVVPRSGS